MTSHDVCSTCTPDVPVTLMIDREQIAGFVLQPLGHLRAIVTDNPLTGDRFFARFDPRFDAYIVESEGPSDLQTF